MQLASDEVLLLSFLLWLLLLLQKLVSISLQFHCFSVFGFLFVKQMKREPPANIPKNVKRIAPNSGESINCQVLFCSADVIAS